MNILCLLLSSPPPPSLAEQTFLGQDLLQNLAPASSCFLYNCSIIIHSVFPSKVRPLLWFSCLLVGHWKPFSVEVIVLHVQHAQPNVNNFLLYKSFLNQHIVYVSVMYDYIDVLDRDKYNLKFFFHRLWMHFMPDFPRHMFPLAWLSVV